MCVLVTGIAGCGATVVHDLVYNPAEGEWFHLFVSCCIYVSRITEEKGRF